MGRKEDQEQDEMKKKSMQFFLYIKIISKSLGVCLKYKIDVVFSGLLKSRASAGVSTQIADFEIEISKNRNETWLIEMNETHRII